MFFCSEVDPADNNESLFSNILNQSILACNKIKTNIDLMTEIKNKGSQSLYGVSQGSIIARYIAQECLREYHIHTFVSLCGPLNGVDHIPYCENRQWYCKFGQYFTDILY